MRIIDLLNKIANGEKLPKKIYCFNREFYLKGNTYFGDTFTLTHYIQEEDLNNEVEILEEEKKIPEKLDQTLNRSDIGEDYYRYIMENRFKLNEIIDYLNSKGE